MSSKLARAIFKRRSNLNVKLNMICLLPWIVKNENKKAFPFFLFIKTILFFLFNCERNLLSIHCLICNDISVISCGQNLLKITGFLAGKDGAYNGLYFMFVDMSCSRPTVTKQNYQTCFFFAERKQEDRKWIRPHNTILRRFPKVFKGTRKCGLHTLASRRS